MAAPPNKPPRTKAEGIKSAYTATFVPYYNSAHNEIVEPLKYDNYLIRRWLPELGPDGFAIVKALRNRCFYKREEGVLRETVEMEMKDLAAATGIGERTLYRIFEKNKTLTEFFVQRITQWQMVGNKPQQQANRFRVSMDEPLHPGDMERYHELLAEKEAEANQPMPRRMVNGMKPKGMRPKEANPEKKRSDALDCQNDSQIETTILPSSLDCQNGGHDDCQFDSPDDCQNGRAIEFIPSGDFCTKDSYTPSAGAHSAPVPLINPPGEEEAHSAPENEPEADLIKGAIAVSRAEAIWNQALRLLKAELSKPTFETHIQNLQLESIDDKTGLVIVSAPTPFIRNWVEGRHLPLIKDCMAEVMDIKLGSLRVELVLARDVTKGL